MSITRKLLSALVALAALTVTAPGQAETPTQEGHNIVVAQASERLQTLVTAISTPVVNIKEVTCLARNIFFEAANEPEEGKVAVGMVTLNRVQDGRFGQSVCGVVDQRTVFSVPREITQTKTVHTGYFRVPQQVTEKVTVYTKQVICQFSWRCQPTKNPKESDERWLESKAIAERLLTKSDSYDDYRYKYSTALYFHAIAIRPSWAKQKEYVGRIGGHKFYGEKEKLASIQ